MNEHGWQNSNKLSECQIISTCHQIIILLWIFFPQPFKNINTIFSSWVEQKQLTTRGGLWAGVGRSLLKRTEIPKSLEDRKSILLSVWALPRPFPASGTYLFKASHEPGPDSERASSKEESWLLLPLPPGGASGKEATCQLRRCKR